jgi:hypothetical protein
MSLRIPAQFTSSPRWWDGLWGGGHTADTDPSRQGWRAALAAKGGSVLVIGRKGQAPCASVQRLSAGWVDVALYADAKPEDVARAMGLKRGDPARDAILGDPLYVQVRATPGWGLTVLDKLRALR